MSAPTTPAAPAAPVQPTLPGTQPAAHDTTVSIPQAFLAELAAAKQQAADLAAKFEAQTASLTTIADENKKTAAQLADAAESKRQMAITHAVRDAARTHSAVDPDEVTTLLAGRFTLDDKGAVIEVGDTKAPAADVVKAFLEKRPHLAAARVARGSGASPYPAPAPQAGVPHDLTTNDGMTAFVRSLTKPTPR